MVVTVKVPSRRHAIRGKFECLKYGLDCEYMEGDVLSITTASLDRVLNICAAIDGSVVAVADRTLSDIS